MANKTFLQLLDEIRQSEILNIFKITKLKGLQVNMQKECRKAWDKWEPIDIVNGSYRNLGIRFKLYREEYKVHLMPQKFNENDVLCVPRVRFGLTKGGRQELVNLCRHYNKILNEIYENK